MDKNMAWIVGGMRMANLCMNVLGKMDKNMVVIVRGIRMANLGMNIILKMGDDMAGNVGGIWIANSYMIIQIGPNIIGKTAYSFLSEKIE